MLLLSFVLVMIVYVIFMVMSYKMDKDYEMLSVYECGFDPMTKTRIMFSYRFFLLSILFLVFDVEIILFLVSPYMILSSVSMWIFIYFTFILIVGLVYEWVMGSLDWM